MLDPAIREFVEGELAGIGDEARACSVPSFVALGNGIRLRGGRPEFALVARAVALSRILDGCPIASIAKEYSIRYALRRSLSARWIEGIVHHVVLSSSVTLRRSSLACARRWFPPCPASAPNTVTKEIFHESLSEASILSFTEEVSEEYLSAEKTSLQMILNSPFIHVDETKINIRGANQYVWVLTDNRHVVLKLTETRESNFILEILKDYRGVLISDFYAGYDAAKCRQQKCLVHLIRDLNDDLWKNPYDAELESFVGSFKSLLSPIIADIDKHGLKRYFLRKHEKSVEKFYQDVVEKECENDLVVGYQKRFWRYRESLFRFLEEDGIPWNNNGAERAIRQLAVQRKISGSFRRDTFGHYLRLLGIAQTCRFQGKSFLGFLLSGQSNVDQFKEAKRRTTSILVPKSSSPTADGR
jgi:hypothetical protein